MNKQASRYFEYNILWSEAICISQVKHLPFSEMNGTMKAIILEVCFPLLTYDVYNQNSFETTRKESIPSTFLDYLWSK